jgi:hypothetical protein
MALIETIQPASFHFSWGTLSSFGMTEKSHTDADNTSGLQMGQGLRSDRSLYQNTNETTCKVWWSNLKRHNDRFFQT